MHVTIVETPFANDVETTDLLLRLTSLPTVQSVFECMFWTQFH